MHDPVAGVLAGLSRLAETAGVDLPTLLERSERLGHGTTTGALPADTALCPATDLPRRCGCAPSAWPPGSLTPSHPAARRPAVPANVPLRVLAGELALMERDGRPEAFVPVTGRAVLAPASGNFKDGCAVLERPLHRPLSPCR
jgi:hypothetical protein